MSHPAFHVSRHAVERYIERIDRGADEKRARQALLDAVDDLSGRTREALDVFRAVDACVRTPSLTIAVRNRTICSCWRRS